MSYEPTEQQDEAVGNFLAGVNLGIQAGAGTGKTSTLELMARATPRSGSYVAFNRAIVLDAQARMPMNVRSKTSHALARGYITRAHGERLNAKRMPSWQLAKQLGVGSLVVVYGKQRKVLQPGFLASLVMRAVNNFSFSADLEPGPQHVPYLDGIDEPVDGKRGWVNNDAIRSELAVPLARAWADLIDPNGKLPFRHDHYVKMWQLDKPEIPGEFVLFDECQDASPVMLAALRWNADRGKQVVLVGDSQQMLYEWRGAVDAFAHFELDATTYLTQSWRFGPAIANAANVVLDTLGSPLRLSGRPGMKSSIGPLATPDVTLCRSNAAAVEAVMRYLEQGRKAHLVGGVDEVVRFAVAVGELQAKGETYHPELACFTSWNEVKAYVDQDPQGDELALMVRLIDEYGVEIIIDALAGMVAEDAADVLVSTAHKSKGREWANVRLAGDFQAPMDGPAGDGERRLGYVACTRAREVLDLRQCEWLVEALTAAGVNPYGAGSTATATSGDGPVHVVGEQPHVGGIRADHLGGAAS